MKSYSGFGVAFFIISCKLQAEPTWDFKLETARSEIKDLGATPWNLECGTWNLRVHLTATFFAAGKP